MSSEYFLTQIIYKPEINNNKDVRIFGEDFVKTKKILLKFYLITKKKTYKIIMKISIKIIIIKMNLISY